MLKLTVAIPAKEVVFIICTVHLLMHIFGNPAGKGIKNSTMKAENRNISVIYDKYFLPHSKSCVQTFRIHGEGVIPSTFLSHTHTYPPCMYTHMHTHSHVDTHIYTHAHMYKHVYGLHVYACVCACMWTHTNPHTLLVEKHGPVMTQAVTG